MSPAGSIHLCFWLLAAAHVVCYNTLMIGTHALPSRHCFSILFFRFTTACRIWIFLCFHPRATFDLSLGSGLYNSRGLRSWHLPWSLSYVLYRFITKPGWKIHTNICISHRLKSIRCEQKLSSSSQEDCCHATAQLECPSHLTVIYKVEACFPPSASTGCYVDMKVGLADMAVRFDNSHLINKTSGKSKISSLSDAMFEILFLLSEIITVTSFKWLAFKNVRIRQSFVSKCTWL